MANISKYYTNDAFAASSKLTPYKYNRMYQNSLETPNEFWTQQGERLDWIKPFTVVSNCSFEKDNFKIKWYEDGILNASVNCIDRHLLQNANKPAIIWEGDDPADSKTFTFQDLYEQVCRFANVLKKTGVKKGDRVTIYLPMIPEAVFAMLACARIGAIHSIVFGGFSPEALAGRIFDCQSTYLITANEGQRGGRTVTLKDNADTAAKLAKGIVKSILVVERTNSKTNMEVGRDHWYHEVACTVSDNCPPEPMKAEDPLFILYTSGSTGKPKGVLHTTGGYMVWASMTHEYAFDLKDEDIYWCTADVGWITGHSYIVYGPLANGTTTLVFEGIPTYPDVSRFWRVIDKHKVSIFYTAPTAIRALMREGEESVLSSDRSSLRLLGSVGEPINPEAWEWYFHIVGEGRCPIVDTWWQTETGGCMIAPLPNTGPMKPGAASRPLFGVEPALVDSDGNFLDGEAEGNLVIQSSWPGQMRTVYGDHDRFLDTYFSTYPGNYFTGDGARRDADGTIWITGRVDDVINVSGHRMGTAEIESALVSHNAIAEAAVVSFPHDIKGQGIYAYVTLKSGLSSSEKLRNSLIRHVRQEIGPIASPDYIQWAPSLPKTRSGKILRRILRKIAQNDFSNLGDTSTLADPSAVDQLINDRAKV